MPLPEEEIKPESPLGHTSGWKFGKSENLKDDAKPELRQVLQAVISVLETNLPAAFMAKLGLLRWAARAGHAAQYHTGRSPSIALG